VLAEAREAVAGVPGSYVLTAREAQEAATATVLASVDAQNARHAAWEASERERVLAEARALVERGQAVRAARPFARLDDSDLVLALQSAEDGLRHDGAALVAEREARERAGTWTAGRLYRRR